MTSFRIHNGQIPPDAIIALLFALAIVHATGQLTIDQAQALTAIGAIAELVLHALQLLRGRR